MEHMGPEERVEKCTVEHMGPEDRVEKCTVEHMGPEERVEKCTVEHMGPEERVVEHVETSACAFCPLGQFLIIGSLWIVSVPSSQMSCLGIRVQVILVTPM